MQVDSGVMHVLIMCIRLDCVCRMMLESADCMCPFIPDCVVQVLAYWLQSLKWVRARQAMRFVVSTARDAICSVYRSGEECANDEALRVEEVDYAERELQALLASRDDAGFDSLIHEPYWHFYSGQVSVSSVTPC